jgi:hypothetical protein
VYNLRKNCACDEKNKIVERVKSGDKHNPQGGAKLETIILAGLKWDDNPLS